MENIQIHILNASNSVEVPRLSKNYLAWSVLDLCAINKLWSIMVHCADRSDPGDLDSLIKVMCYCKISWPNFKILKLIFCKNEKSGMSKCVKLNYTNLSHTCHCSK